MRTTPEFEIVAPPRWSLVVFRIRGTPGGEDVDALNRRFWDAISSESEKLALTQTVLPEVGFCIRLAVGSPQTEPQHIDETFDILKSLASKVAATP